MVKQWIDIVRNPVPEILQPEWQKSLSVLVELAAIPDDVGVERPNFKSVSSAICYAFYMGSIGLPAPDKIVADSNGGVVFELNNGIESENIHFWDDGEIEYIAFENNKVIEQIKGLKSPDSQ
jgi:hypothetical protein